MACAEPEKSALYVWGYNVNGQTSHESGISGDPRTWRCQRLPQPVPAEKFQIGNRRPVCLIDVDCGLSHTAAVASDGSLFTWGSNDCGQLGDGMEVDCRKPRRVKALKTEVVNSAACGAHCTMAITSKRGAAGSSATEYGRLWVWGQNQGSNLPRLFSGAFPPNTIVKQVACGTSHAAAISNEGLLQTWGYNECGQLGRGFCCDGRQEARIVTTFVRHLQEVPGPLPVEAVACGDYHTACITGKGELYTWGLGVSGQLGHRTVKGGRQEALPRRVVALEGVPIAQVACGQAHTCGVSTGGALYMWGGGREGQLGLGHLLHGLPLGSTSSGGALQPMPVPVMPRGVRAVTCGQCHTLAATADGRILGWGYNSCGQAATGRSPYAWHPTSIDWCVGEVSKLAAGGGHSAVLTHAKTLRELCEFQLAASVSPTLAPRIVEVASRIHADSLVRYCQRYSDHHASSEDIDIDEDEERRRRPRNLGKQSITVSGKQSCKVGAS